MPTNSTVGFVAAIVINIVGFVIVSLVIIIRVIAGFSVKGLVICGRLPAGVTFVIVMKVSMSVFVSFSDLERLRMMRWAM